MPIIKPKGMIIKGDYYRPRSGTVVVGRQKSKNIRCPHCKSRKYLRKKAKIVREVPHIQILDERVIIRWEGHKYFCNACNRYFRERFPGVLPRRRYTEAYRKEVFNLHKQGISQKDLSRLKRIGSATVERWFHQLLERKNKEYNSYQYPEQIGIDEHRFSKKVGFATTLCDLKRHRILDVYKGKSVDQIRGALMKIPGRERVKMVNMDMSESYRALVKEVFPSAIRVADRFHVIRLINQHMLKTWHQLDPEAKNNRGLLSLMRRHEWKMTESQRIRFEQYLQEVPGLKPIYSFKQNLVKLLLIKSRTEKQCKPLISQLLLKIAQLKSSNFEAMVTLGNSLDDWKEEIAAMWRFTKTNSITEGFHRKMKLIQRRAYGFKNFQNYRLRVRVLCGSMSSNSILT